MTMPHSFPHSGGIHSRKQNVVTACNATHDPGGDRTHDLRIKSPLLYQLSYRAERET